MMPRQLALPFAPARDTSEAAFLHAPCNADSWAFLARTADWPQSRLAIWGEEGTGKTHLLHIWARRHSAHILCGPTLRYTEPHPGALAIDDADLAPEHDLLHILNAQAEAHRPVLLAARPAPARWNPALPDLASRLRALVSVEILPPDDELLRKFLARQLRLRQLTVPEDIQDFLRLRLPRTQAAMHQAAAELDRLSLRLGRRITLALARDVAAALTAAPDHEVFAHASHAPAPLL